MFETTLAASGGLLAASFIEALDDSWSYYLRNSSPHLLCDEEQELSNEILRIHGTKDFFHGGNGKLDIGETLLPSSIHQYDLRGYGRFSEHIDFVHISACLETARHYAGNIIDGAIYKARPDATITINPVVLRQMKSVSDRADIPNRWILQSFGLARWIYATRPNFICRSAVIAEKCVDGVWRKDGLEK